MKISVLLSAKWVEYLSRLPESGMGYQLVDVILDDGSRLENCLVFNAERLELPEGMAQKAIKDIRLRAMP